MKALCGGLLLACLVFFSGLAQAADKTVSWHNPTQNTDGSSLPPELIDKTTVVWAPTQAGLPASTTTKVATGSVTSTTITLTPGTWFVAAKTTAKNGNTSVLSAAFQVVVSDPVPNPPTGVTVTSQETTAFQVVGTLDKFVLLPVGTVPAGTECNPTQSVNGHNGVPRASVAWFGSVKPQAVVAKCDG